MNAQTGSPFVLCGPIVRRVDPGSVTVFVAVRSACTVALTVFAAGAGPEHPRGETVMTGRRQAVKLGQNLYVVAVTATGPALAQGTLYGYDLAFPGSPGGWPSLLAPGAAAADEASARALLTYAGDPHAPSGAPAYPSFVTPPADPNRLRLFHGSCRRPHGEGRDALPELDPILATAIGDPLRRPHQLILGGDQIYADNVADTLLSAMHGHDAVPAREGFPAVPALTGVGALLGMTAESLPGVAGGRADHTFTPGNRAEIMKQAAFTSDEADSHLMALREYAAMYLMVWSDQLWPAELPRFEDVFPAETRILRDPQSGAPGQTVYDLMVTGQTYLPSAQQAAIVPRYQRWQKQYVQLRDFRQGLPAVRRALANIATYMIADDHEVSDDWNMTMSWVRGAAVESELGRRIVRNGMAAYAIFQAWGNTPDRFAEQGAAGAPGRELLQAVQGWLAAPGAAADASMRERLGVPAGLTAEGRMDRPPGALTYHFCVTWPRYQLLALDTRTWREFRAPGGHPGGLLLADHPLDEMVTGDGVLGDDAVTVVAQPVALFGMPLVEQIAQPVMRAIKGTYAADSEDAWVTSEPATHKFLGRLMSAAPAGADGVRRRRIVMLGGDIHFGFAERIRYSATLPYTCGPDPALPHQGTNPTEGVIAGFVSSALHNEGFLTHQLHKRGYVPFAHTLPRMDLVGWANEDEGREGARFRAGVETAVAAASVNGWWLSGRPAVGDLDRLKVITQPPDWQVNVQFLQHDEADPATTRPGEADPVTDPAGLPRQEALQQYLSASRNLDGYLGAWGSGKEIVGYNNLGEITFDWPAGECKTATQRLWWRLPGADRAAALTTFTVDLSYGCSLMTPAPYGFSLRPGDYDAHDDEWARYDGVERQPTVVTGRWVERLQQDLAALGFHAKGARPGEFDSPTYWAVREFQTYARQDQVAHEPAGATAPRYSDRLERVEVAEADRYLGPVSGAADLATQLAVKRWLDRRWRCPVVVESWQVADGTPRQLAAPNVWRPDEVTAADQRLYSRVITGRPERAGRAPLGHPELIPLGGYRNWPTWPGPVVDAESEVTPQAMIPPVAGELTGPTLAALTTAINGGGAAAERAKARLSAFKVLRAVSENVVADSAGAYFDTVNGADGAVLRVGPFGWRAHGPLTEQVDLPSGPDEPAQPGQLWAFLSYLRARDLDAFDALGGPAGLSAVPGWRDDGSPVRHRPLRVARAHAAFTDASGAVRLPADNLADLRDLRAWHWIHRFVLGLRGHDGVRRGMWIFARQGLYDLLHTPWDGPAPAPATVADVAGDDGRPRRARIGDVFTSERAAAMLLCWQSYRAHQLVSAAAPNAGEPVPQYLLPRAATDLRAVLAIARTLGPDFTAPPTAWTGAHENALITALAQRTAPDAPVSAALTAVRAWPSWPAGRGYTLPVQDLAAAERTLSPARGSMRLDSADLTEIEVIP